MKKQRNTSNLIQLFSVIVAGVLCAVILFFFIYCFDNKYTAAGPQPERGVLLLSEDDLQEYSFVHLITGWEFYRNKLLEPEDFSQGFVVPDEYIFIGQYGGFEGHVEDKKPTHSPHGSATYRLNISLPSKVTNYTLELPEIYSAYKLYVNGELVMQMGDPSPETYEVETGNKKISFRTANRLELIFAVTDYSHFYSGMVYPPAFGESNIVDNILNLRFGLSFAGMAFSVAVGVFYLGVWLLLKRNGIRKSIFSLYFTVLCLCYALYISYPVVKTLFTMGAWWYRLEILFYPVLLLLITLIQSKLVKLDNFLSEGIITFGVFVCIWSASMHWIMKSSLKMMMAYSTLLTLYTLTVSIFLLATSLYSALKNTIYSKTMLFASIVFAMSLLLDRFLPLFEPIRFGWFAEIAGGFVIGSILATEAASDFRHRLLLETRVENVTNMMNVQKTYYPVILEKEEELRMARHDFRHHMLIIREFVTKKNTLKLMEYIDSLEHRTRLETDVSYCNHYITDMLLRMYTGFAEKEDTPVFIEANLPDTLPFDDVDICVIISNMLENALEASAKISKEDREIHVRIQCKMNHFGIFVKNTFDGIVNTQHQIFLSRKRPGKKGIGLDSIHSIASKYEGSAEFYVTEDSFFHSEVVLPMRERRRSNEDRNL